MIVDIRDDSNQVSRKIQREIINFSRIRQYKVFSYKYVEIRIKKTDIYFLHSQLILTSKSACLFYNQTVKCIFDDIFDDVNSTRLEPRSSPFIKVKVSFLFRIR